MKYYGYTKEQIDKMVTCLNSISVTGMAQNDAFHEATGILRYPMEIDIPEKGENGDGEEIHKD